MTYDRARALAHVGLESVYDEWRRAESRAAKNPREACRLYEEYIRGAMLGALLILVEVEIFTKEEVNEWRKKRNV